MIFSLDLVNTLTRITERNTDMIQLVLLWQGWNAVEMFLEFSSLSWQRGTLQLIANHPLHDVLEYMQIAIIKTEAAYFVRTNTLVILKTFAHGCNKI